MRLRCLEVNPAARFRAGRRIQPHEFAYTQAATVQQLDDSRVARLQPGVLGVIVKTRQRDRIVHTERFGQGFGRFGGAHVQHRIRIDQTFAAQPGVKTAPAGQNQRNTAATAPAAVHLHDPVADVRVTHGQQDNVGFEGEFVELLQIQRVKLDGSWGQAFLNSDVLQVTFDQRGAVN